MKNNVAAALALLAILVMPIITVSAPTYKVGVKVGDWAKYDMTGDWRVVPSTANLTEPQEVKDANEVKWIEIRVLGVSGTEVTIQVTTQYKNETEKTSTHSGDVRTGSGDLNLQVIAGGLSEGDKIYEAAGALQIIETALRFYAGFERKINLAYFILPADTGMQTTYAFRWDKATGIVTQTYMERMAILEDFNSTALLIMKMTETNMFQAEASFGPVVIWIVAVGATVILITFAYVTMRSKGRKKRKH